MYWRQYSIMTKPIKTNTYADKVSNIINESEKIIIALVGPSGCGKTSLLSEIVPNMEKKCVILSLDDFRIKHNKGVYPTGKNHVEVNKIAIPAFTKAVTEETSPVIFLDNTHLKWEPDCSQVIKKAKKDGYDVLFLYTAVSEYSLFTNRSTHGVDDTMFLKMAARWGGHRMGDITNRIIPYQLLENVAPTKPDTFSVDKMFIIKWHDGYLYVLDNYLGYVDRIMCIHAIKAANYLKQKRIGADPFRKDGIVHITLVQPKSGLDKEMLKKYATELSKKDRININYSGIGCVNKDDNKVYYLTIEENSSIALTTALHKINKNIPVNKDGYHVTLGYDSSDIWNVDKREPTFYITPKEWSLLSMTYDMPIKSKFSVKDLEKMETDDSAVFEKYINDKYPEGVDFDIDENLKIRIGKLLKNNNIKVKWRTCPETISLIKGSEGLKGEIDLMSFSVFNGHKPDDEIYKSSKFIQSAVPRGLCFVFFAEYMPFDGKVMFQHISVVFPTPKFFGDNDTEEDVEVISDDDLRNSIPKDASFLITEKANGEMFTFTCASLDDKKEHAAVIMGSKNNKFALSVNLRDFCISDVEAQVQAYLALEGREKEFTKENLQSREWTNQNMWVEMILVCCKILGSMTADTRYDLLKFLHEGNWTACGEFESYLHPHLEMFSCGHQKIKFFALSTYDAQYNCMPKDVDGNTERLQQLEKFGLDIVQLQKSAKKSIVDIRKDLIYTAWKEGIVVHVISPTDNKVHSMVKLKTIWYVVHRGIREKLKRLIITEIKSTKTAKVKGKPNVTTIEELFKQNLPKMKKVIHDTVIAKLRDIFHEDMQSETTKHYVEYVKKLMKHVEEKAISRKDFLELAYTFRYDYPRLIEIVEKSM